MGYKCFRLTSFEGSYSELEKVVGCRAHFVSSDLNKNFDKKVVSKKIYFYLSVAKPKSANERPWCVN